MTVTASTFPLFPGCPTFGFSSQPDYLVKKVRRESGYERRDGKWSQPLHRYEGMPIGARPQADIEELLNFWHSMGGELEAFRFKDWADFKSCGLDDEVSTALINQPLTAVSGSPSGYQLYKRYSVGSFIKDRAITKPKGDTIRVANETGTEQSSAAFRVEEDTGLIIALGGFSGTPTFWAGEFYVKCRFDGPFNVQIVNHKVQSLTLSIIELRDEP